MPKDLLVTSAAVGLCDHQNHSSCSNLPLHWVLLWWIVGWIFALDSVELTGVEAKVTGRKLRAPCSMCMGWTVASRPTGSSDWSNEDPSSMWRPFIYIRLTESYFDQRVHELEY